MAGVSLVKGLYHWAVDLRVSTPSATAASQTIQTPYQAATVFFAVIDLVAAVGLWLAAPWGAVVWLTSVISMVAVERCFRKSMAGACGWSAIEIVLLGVYLWLALMAAREQPP